MIPEENYWNDAGKLELFVSQAEIDRCNTIEWSRRLNKCTIRRQRDQVVWEDFENCKDESNGSWQLILKVTEILKKESWYQHYYKTMSAWLGTKKTNTRNKNSKGRLEFLNPNYEYWRFLLLKVQVLLLFCGAETLTDLKNSIIWLKHQIVFSQRSQKVCCSLFAGWKMSDPQTKQLKLGLRKTCQVPEWGGVLFNAFEDSSDKAENMVI
jgi:hypothetical protein